MSGLGCPGSKHARQPKPELFPCPGCKKDVEIWTDEFSRRCPSCGTIVARDATMGCLEWCSMARECVGEKAYASFNEMRAASIKERLSVFVEESLPDRSAAAELAHRSISYAEQLAKKEHADLHVVIAAAALSACMKGRGDTARGELLKLGFQLEDIDEICGIINNPGNKADNSINRRVVHDALLLAGSNAAGTGALSTSAAAAMKTDP